MQSQKKGCGLEIFLSLWPKWQTAEQTCKRENKEHRNYKYIHTKNVQFHERRTAMWTCKNKAASQNWAHQCGRGKQFVQSESEIRLLKRLGWEIAYRKIKQDL